MVTGGVDLRRLAGEEEEEDEGDADRCCCSRSFSRSPLRMYLVGGCGASAEPEADVLATDEAEASSAALRLLAISALRKSMILTKVSMKGEMEES